MHAPGMHHNIICLQELDSFLNGPRAFLSRLGPEAMAVEE